LFAEAETPVIKDMAAREELRARLEGNILTAIGEALED
jgi:hypothetical protein